MAGGCDMSALHRHLDDYLALRRRLGFKLERAGRLLAQFVHYCDEAGIEVVTVEVALAWATSPVECSPMWGAHRLCVARGFLRFLHALEPRTGVPPTGLLSSGPTRANPYLYSLEQVTALMRAARGIHSKLRGASMEAVIGLLACSGMRVGEALALDRGDVDLRQGVLTIRQAKFDKTRELPLHPTTTAALAAYAKRRDELAPAAPNPAFFVSAAGTRILYCNFHRGFRELVRRAGIEARSPSCRPRPHDLRHTFAVATLAHWQREGDDVGAKLPVLSTYLGHVDPAATYWYLSGSTEVLSLAAARLEAAYGDEP
jgi:integrase/recombinase XerD